ncbi:MAG: CBS and ACT domain-containing protein [Bacillota bacterium]
MLVEDVMRVNLITLKPEDSVLDALQKAKENRIRHLPVVEGDRLAGIVSDRDLRDAKPSIFVPEDLDLLKAKKVKDIMKANIITAHPLDSVDEAARILYEHKIGCLPVIKDEKLVGIVTETDLLRSLVELMGATNPGSLITIEFVDRPGILADVSGIIKNYGININSVFLRKSKKKPGHTLLSMRIATIMPEHIVSEIKKAGFTVTWPMDGGI